jgi:hypothetical protein
VRFVNAALCRALLERAADAAHVRGALPIVAARGAACLLVFESALLASAALELDGSLALDGAVLALRRPQGWRAADAPSALQPLKVHLDRVGDGAGPPGSAAETRAPPPPPPPPQLAAPAAPAAKPRAATLPTAAAIAAAAAKAKAAALVRAPAAAKPAKKKSAAGGASAGAAAALDATAALKPEAVARVARVRAALKRDALDCLELLCSREKGGMMHVACVEGRARARAPATWDPTR